MRRKELANTILVLLIVSVTIQIFGYYIGCKKQIISYNNLKLFFMINKLIGLGLYAYWLTISFKKVFHSNVIFNIIGLCLLLIGGYIIFAVYKTIGEAAVYYGKEYDVPNIPQEYNKNFPYNFTNHPLYVGIIFSLFGLFFTTGFDKNNKVRKTVLYLLVYMVTLYIISICIENKCVSNL